MPRSLPIQIGTIDFKNRSVAETYVRNLVARYVNGQKIVGLDDIFLRDLILLHSESVQKIGCGIDYFTIQQNAIYRKNREFKLVRFDGSYTEFSWPNCINGNSHRRDVLKALRAAISEQSIAFKVDQFRFGGVLLCPLSRKILTEDNCQVDHEFPKTFSSLVLQWLGSLNMEIDGIKIVESVDNQIICELADRELVVNWKQFHKGNAKLRLLETRENLSRNNMPRTAI